MTARKTVALTRWSFAGKMMLLLLNMLSKLIIAFLPRSQRLLISWLQLTSAVILEIKKVKSLLFPFFPHMTGFSGSKFPYKGKLCSSTRKVTQ